MKIEHQIEITKVRLSIINLNSQKQNKKEELMGFYQIVRKKRRILFKRIAYFEIVKKN